MDTSILKEMFLAEKKENEEYIDRFYKRNYEIEEIIWKIERHEREYEKNKLVVLEA